MKHMNATTKPQSPACELSPGHSSNLSKIYDLQRGTNSEISSSITVEPSEQASSSAPIMK